MKCILLCAVVIATLSLSHGSVKLHPLSDEFINSINSKQTTWKAGRNFDINTPMSKIRGLMGTLIPTNNTHKLPVKVHSKKVPIPESFDAREKWPECAEIIGTIRDQANCGACWAFGAAEAMSDRICIRSGGKTKILISAEDILSCADHDRSSCSGGLTSDAWNLWGERGIVTGGLYGSTDGCKAYSLPPCNHYNTSADLPSCDALIDDTPKCRESCDSGSSLDFNNDLRFGSAYSLDPDESQMQTEIMTFGPVEATYAVYEDFLSYKSGVYQHTDGYAVGYHAVKILGWGVENDTPYWLAANSWNSGWGDNGYFKILRGSDECMIERFIDAGIPRL